MARIAVVRAKDNVCINLIVAEVNDPPYEGTYLVDVDNLQCNIGWVYDPVMIDFINPNPPPIDDAGGG